MTQPIQHSEIFRESPNLFSATEVAATIGVDLTTINLWLEIGAIDRAVFGGGRFSKYELQRAALLFELVKLGLTPSSARDIIREVEDDLQQIWAEAVASNYKTYAIVLPNRRKKKLVFWCWKKSTEKIALAPSNQIILPVTEILARVIDRTNQLRDI